ncbi:hypothetical protein [Streptomyces solicathayae]|uniref:Integral membrane protein n=1 Tax=Streptomyces solicathayae TaxID=3081768 RepID=A0ABZ0LKF5_9ACTN|nr:hypothetical protein [Streptomyces sp. HUAS YS2]WOX19921.1 hypothetical protein R2D22_00270 [Streptomyces sp. HUAS YS2]
MSGDSGGDRAEHEHDEDRRKRVELLWRIGTVVAGVAFVIFLISIYEDPGSVCGTGQDKGPC